MPRIVVKKIGDNYSNGKNDNGSSNNVVRWASKDLKREVKEKENFGEDF